MPSLQERYYDMLMERVRNDRYPSHQMLDRIEASFWTPQQVIEYVVLGDYSPQELADRRRVKRSTIYNLKNQAEDRLKRDDVFFVELHHLRVVRDHARLAYISAQHPDGHLADGRRRIAIAA